MSILSSPQNNPKKLKIAVKRRIADAPSNASHIWVHVEDIIGSEGYCRCEKCPENSRHSYSLEHGTTSISRHLAKKHSIYTSGSSLLQKQLTLGKQLLNAEKMPAQKLALVNKSLSRLIIDSKDSFLSVVNPFFNSFCRALNHSHEEISRMTASRSVNDECEIALEVFIQEIQKEGIKLTIASNGWDSTTGRPFLLFVAHWTDLDFSLNHVTFAVKNFPGSHNAVATEGMIYDSIDEFEFAPYLFAYVTDGGTELKPALRAVRTASMSSLDQEILLRFDWHTTCASHALDNVCKKAEEAMKHLL